MSAAMLCVSSCYFTMDVTRVPLVTRRAFNVAAQTPAAPSMAGAATLELPYVAHIPLAGWGAFSGTARVAETNDVLARRLRVRALVLQDPSGARVVFISTDLHGGSRYLTEYVASQLIAEGFHAGNVFFTATHNHAGPGGLYASPYFDGMMASTPMFKTPRDENRVAFNRDLADRIGDLAVEAVKRAINPMNFKSALIGFGTGRFELAVNRSPSAFAENFGGDELRAATAMRMRHWQAADTKRTLASLAFDPTVYTIAAFEQTAPQKLIGSFSTVNVHAALLHRDARTQSADFFGQAAYDTERDLGGSIGVAAGAQGDVDPMIPGKTLRAFDQQRAIDLATMKTQPQDPALLVMKFGDSLKQSIVDSIGQARSQARALTRVRVAFSEQSIAGRYLEGVKRMPFTPELGQAAVAGSELGRGPLIFREGQRTPSESLQSPKDTSATWFYNPPLSASNALLAHQDPGFPLRLVELTTKNATTRILGVPGEPTTWLGAELRLQIGADDANAMIAGVTGDYQGYLTSTAEYSSQQYEGGSTIWGPDTETHLRLETLQLLNQLSTDNLYLPPAGPVSFNFTEETWLNRIDPNTNEGCFGQAQSTTCAAHYGAMAARFPTRKAEFHNKLCALCNEGPSACEHETLQQWLADWFRGEICPVSQRPPSVPGAVRSTAH